jgi:hypothetical protein
MQITLESAKDAARAYEGGLLAGMTYAVSRQFNG